MQESIIDREHAQRSVVQLPALVEHALAVVRMQAFRPELQRLEALEPVGRKAADVAEAVVDVGGAFVEVHLVEAQAVQVGRGGVAGFTLAQHLFRAPPGERIGEDLRDQLQALHQLGRPAALRPECVAAQDPQGRLARQRERKRQVRLHAHAAAHLAVDAGLRRKIVERCHGDGPAGPNLFEEPGELLLTQGLEGLPVRHGVVEVSGLQQCRGIARPLPENGEIEIEELTDAAQRVVDFRDRRRRETN